MLDRSQAPTFKQDFSFELPEVEVIPLSDKLDLVFLPGLKQDIFKMEIVFAAGKWFEPKIGVAHFTALMLDKGTKEKSAQKIAELLDYFGAQIEISSGYDFTSVALYGLKKYFKETFTVFMEIISQPTFPEAEFEIQREIFVQSLRVNNEKNNFVASKLLRKNIFGGNHPYGSSLEEDAITHLSSDDLHKYFNTSFYPLELFLIGNFEKPFLTWVVSNFKIKQSTEPIEQKVIISAGPTVQRIEKEESVQSSVRLGQRTINRDHKDYFSLLIANHILGGYFGSRLMKNIREKKGLTYGIFSSIASFKNDSMLSIGADVGKDKLDLALQEIKNEILLLYQEPIPNSEFEIAKNHLLGSLQLEVANPFVTLDKIKNIRLNKLEADYYNRLVSSLKEETPGHLKSITEKYFSSTFFEVTVG